MPSLFGSGILHGTPRNRGTGVPGTLESGSARRGFVGIRFPPCTPDAHFNGHNGAAALT